MTILETIREKVQLQEGIGILEKILVYIHYLNITATKELSRLVCLPVPVVAAVKNEFIRAGLLKRAAGITVTLSGAELIENGLGYAGLSRELFCRLLTEKNSWKSTLASYYAGLEEIFSRRPRVDVTLDQSKSTAETVLKRACLSLVNFQLVGKTVLCLGDDDLVSVGLGLLLKELSGPQNRAARIIVVDIDENILAYIRETAEKHALPVVCYKHDIRSPLPAELNHICHTVFTDPPYTLSGLTLFLSRALKALINRREQVIFLSFAHKSPDFFLRAYEQILAMGLVPVEIIPGFNRYEGAEIIGNQSQMIVLKTTGGEPVIKGDFEGLLYTGEIYRTVRKYQCRQCKKIVPVGREERYATIEQLKEEHCPFCGEDVFLLLEKKTNRS